MELTLGQLIDQLADIQSDLADAGIDPATIKVRMAHQPDYPLAALIGTLSVEPARDGSEPTVWIAEGGSDYERPYAPRAAFDGDWDYQG